MSKMEPLIDFIVDGKKFAIRNNWALVPRVGDTVILKGGEVWVEVTQVIWSDDNQQVQRQWLQLVCKSIPDQSRAQG